MNPFCYRKLPKYKYQLTKSYSINTGIIPEKIIQTDFLKLDMAGNLMIMKHYSWDGTTWAPDHRHNMRASLVHDALYQLMRLGKLEHKIWREQADDLFYTICMKDHAVPLIAKSYRLALKLFGERYARPNPSANNREICS